MRRAREDGVAEGLHGDRAALEAHVRGQKLVEGEENIRGISRDADVLGASRDVSRRLVRLEQSRNQRGLGERFLAGQELLVVEGLVAIKREDVPRDNLRDLPEPHRETLAGFRGFVVRRRGRRHPQLLGVAHAPDLVAQLRHPRRAALGVGHDEHVARARRELASVSHARGGVHQAVALPHQLQGGDRLGADVIAGGTRGRLGGHRAELQPTSARNRGRESRAGRGEPGLGGARQAAVRGEDCARRSFR